MPQAWQESLGLAPRIRRKHLVGFILHSTASITFLVLLNSSQPTLINYLSSLKKDEKGDSDPTLVYALGRLNSLLLFSDEAASIFLVLFWGSMAELIGARSVAVFGYLLIAIGLNFFAVAQNAWPDLLIARLVFALGGSAVTSMLSGLLASFTATDDQAQPQESVGATEETPLLPERARSNQARSGSGKLASIAGVFTGVGALIAVFGLLRLPPILAKWLDESVGTSKKKHGHAPPHSPVEDRNALLGLRYTLGLSGALAILIALTLRFTLPSPEPMTFTRDTTVFSQIPEGAEQIQDDVTPVAAVEAAFESESSSGFRRRFQAPLSLYADDREARRRRLRARLARRDERSLKASIIRLFRGLVQGISAAGNSRTLVTAYIGGAMARATTVGTTAFLPLLVAHFFYDSGICSNLPDPTVPVDEIKRKCRQAFTWTSIISGVAQLTALVLSPFIGVIADRISAEATMCLAALSGTSGYILFAYGLPGGVDGDPRSTQAIVAAGLIGVCQIGTIICSLALLAKARRTQKFAAGPLAGAYSFFGGLGILLLSTVGAALFDLYTPSPFIVLAALAGLTSLTSLMGWATMR